MVYLITFILIAFSALFSGLTLGLMGLDVHELKRKIKLKDRQAKRIYAVRKRGNLLLTTLLLGNVAVNATLSIYLGSIAVGVVAGFIATGVIFLFGEIIPQAVISRHAMAFGAKTAWIVNILIIIFYPITAPIAWALDKALGREMPTLYSRKELISIIEEHEDSEQSSIDRDEERIAKGALTFSRKFVKDVMTPKKVAVMVEIEEKLNPALVAKLKKSGLSRFPVYQDERENIVGTLYLRELAGRSLTGKKVKSFYEPKTIVISDSALLDTALNKFIRTKHHLFIVENEFGNVEGLISIEDIIEEIIDREIVDEFDQYADMRQSAKKKAKKK
ncbi:MAG: CNNM domain-containing protein [Candidatus Uhrbacteria bacterium]|nr:DUF21 domain-containing protein [Patescibacteria group bacterium]MBU1907219.1 DUF21 domain-containing protein [Patescibacteria group bacterium]